MGFIYPFLEIDEESTMRKAAEKLKSSRGASLMMALLLFLVCAVVGSAVLTAGTAASGRMSKIAESDQRYYSVNSAASLLIDLYKDQTVTIKTTIGDDPTNPTYTIQGIEYTADTLPTSFDSLPLETACRLIARKDTGTPLTFTMTANNISAIGTPATVKETIYPDDRLEFTISSNPGAADNYQLTLVFTAIKQETPDLNVTDGTTATVTSIAWELGDIK